MTQPNSFGWFQAHLPWLLVTILLLLLVYLRRPDHRESIHSSIILAGLLLLAGMVQLFYPDILPLADSAAFLSGAVDIGIGLLFIRVWGLIVFKLLLPLARIKPPAIVADIAVSIAYLVWGAIRLHMAGMAVGEIVTTSAVLTAVIAFALQDTLGNLLAGIAIQLDNSIRVGDWIALDGVAGRVSEINWRATSLETRNWETVVIPNSQLLKNRFTVLGKRKHAPLQWRRWVWFDLTLETLPSQIIAMVNKSLAETRIPNVSKEPKPNCILMDVEHGVARFAVRYWLTDLQEDDPTDSAIRNLIDATLRRNERRLTPPIFNVLMTKEKEQIHARHKRHTKERVQHLQRLSLFGMLGEEDLLILADSLKFTPFVAGDTMLEQGEVSQWLFIVMSGEAEMRVATPDGEGMSLGRLGQGEFFGEMGLLTGEPSLYSVKACQDVECYRVGRELFQEIFLKREELVGLLSEALQLRLKEQQRLWENLPATPAAAPPADLLGTLRSYFGLG
ncbi:mechanosensitive ion channel family protein [Paludibacterium paludis]|uniref:Mechanosensitive ion channel protein MscS n=1 Tax=Paludibacterium paludis TaxID=1225769 RepID=A0A918P1Y5_9NEIS|nr:mechanosensitive ion channel family protein [Paludibacterium paludis]GGY13144.1 mechanosensitive ion channel protein MscS [Paludibacterium paludis]